jgi:hypothetical protein
MDLIIIKKIIFDFFIATIISLFIFAIYVEINPKLTNIWYRLNANNVRVISLGGLFELIKAPLFNNYYWQLQFWDINYYIYLLFSFIFISVKFSGNYQIIPN